MDGQEILNIYLLVFYTLSFFVIFQVVWSFEHEKIMNSKEMKILINILFADLSWCLLYIIDITLIMTDMRAKTQQIILATLMSIALEISMTFAVLIAFCAYRNIHDSQFLHRKNNHRNILLIGYICPLMTSMLQLLLFEEKDSTFMKNIFFIFVPLLYICISLIIYLMIEILLRRFKLSNDQKREINTVFLFPSIIFLFIFMPNLCFEIQRWISNTTICIILESLATLIFPFYALIDCWAYGRTIKILIVKKKTLTIQSFDSNLSLSLSENEITLSDSYSQKLSENENCAR